jgi:hypothetical protein
LKRWPDFASNSFYRYSLQLIIAYADLTIKKKVFQEGGKNDLEELMWKLIACVISKKMKKDT